MSSKSWMRGTAPIEVSLWIAGSKPECVAHGVGDRQNRVFVAASRVEQAVVADRHGKLGVGVGPADGAALAGMADGARVFRRAHRRLVATVPVPADSGRK